MKKINLALLIILLLAAALVILSGCGPSEPPHTTYYPDEVTVRFYDNPSEPPIATSVYNRADFGGSAESMAQKIGEEMPVPEKAASKFLGYMTDKPEYYPFDIAREYALRSETNMTEHPYLEWYEQFYNLYGDFYLDEPTPKMEVDLYACWEVASYQIIFNFGSLTQVKRDDSLAPVYNGYGNYRGTYDQAEYAPGGYSETQAIIGWQDSLGRQIFDFAGRPVYTAEEMFLMYTNYAQREEEGWSFSTSRVYCTPILDDKFALLTLDYGAEGDFDGYAMAYYDRPAQEAELPWEYLNGMCITGWSTSPDEYVAYEGEVDGDKTLYAVWTPARALNLKYGDGEMKIYVTEKGDILYDKPRGLEKMEVLRFYADSDMKSRIDLTYQTAVGRENVYGVLEEAYKEITLVPSNGDSPYTVTLSVHDAEGALRLPVWQGYEIVGWYLTRDCVGDAVELSFDSVTDGATYYAKWERAQ